MESSESSETGEDKFEEPHGELINLLRETFLSTSFQDGFKSIANEKYELLNELSKQNQKGQLMSEEIAHERFVCALTSGHEQASNQFISQSQRKYFGADERNREPTRGS